MHLFLIIPSKNLINHKYKLRQMIGLHPYQQCQFSLFFFLMHFVSFLGLDFPKNTLIAKLPGLSQLPDPYGPWNPHEPILTLIGKSWKTHPELFRNFSFPGCDTDGFLENSSSIVSKLQFSGAWPGPISGKFIH